MLYDSTSRRFFFDPFAFHFFAGSTDGAAGLTPRDVQPSYTSRLLHEVTHQDCLHTDFGLGLLGRLMWLRRQHSNPKPVLTSDGHPLPSHRGGTVMVHELGTAKVMPVLGCAVPVLEGLAMWAQLDMRLSVYEVSSPHCTAAIALLGGTGKLERGSPNSLLSQVRQFHDTCRIWARTDGNVFLNLLLGLDGSNSYYLFGYLYVLALVHVLRSKEPRFQCDDVTYCFLRNYLLNGADWSAWDLWPTTLFQSRLESLHRCPPDRLTFMADILMSGDFESANTMDVARFIQTGDRRERALDESVRFWVKDNMDAWVDVVALWESLRFISLKTVFVRPLARDDSRHCFIVRGESSDKYSVAALHLSESAYQHVMSKCDGRSTIPSLTEVTSLEEEPKEGVPWFFWSHGTTSELPQPIEVLSGHGWCIVIRGPLDDRLKMAFDGGMLSYQARHDVSQFLFAKGDPGFLGISIEDLCLMVFRTVFNDDLTGAGFRALRESGFGCIAEVEAALGDDFELIASSKTAINGRLRYPLL